MAEPSSWTQRDRSPNWHVRYCGRFELWSSIDGEWDIEDPAAGVNPVVRGTADDLASAKLAAESALRKLLTEALEALGPEP